MLKPFITIHIDIGRRKYAMENKPRKGRCGWCFKKKTVDIKNDKPKVVSGTRIITSEFSETNSQQRWEFLIPRVHVPAGWIRIRNVSSGDFLQQNYLSSPPFLAPAQYGSNASNLRGTWGTQWAFTLPSGHKIDSAHNGWCIKNRLTTGLLETAIMRFGESIRYTVNAADFKYILNRWQIWELEINEEGYWKIKNMRTKNVLEKDRQNLEERIEDGVTCVQKKTLDRNGDLWEFL
ncbi:hypothetical protein RUND412_004524 [Rhizina undulata]